MSQGGRKSIETKHKILYPGPTNVRRREKRKKKKRRAVRHRTCSQSHLGGSKASRLDRLGGEVVGIPKQMKSWGT